jgi:hypothetical protein
MTTQARELSTSPQPLLLGTVLRVPFPAGCGYDGVWTASRQPAHTPWITRFIPPIRTKPFFLFGEKERTKEKPIPSWYTHIYVNVDLCNQGDISNEFQ